MNKETAEICRNEITFLGHKVTSGDLKIDPEKVGAILKMQKPANVEDVQRFCGLVIYLVRFPPEPCDFTLCLPRLSAHRCQ